MRLKKFQLKRNVLAANYSHCWIVKHHTYFGNRFIYALSDGSYAVLFDENITIMRSNETTTESFRINGSVIQCNPLQVGIGTCAHTN